MKLGWKKYFMIALIIGGLGIGVSSEASARSPHSGVKVVKMMFKDVALTETQKQSLKELRKEMKGKREDVRGAHGKRMEWMEDFASGRISRAEVLSQIDDKFDTHSALRRERLEGMLDILDGLERDQKSQVLDNLDEIEEKMEQKRAKFETKSGKRKGASKKMKRLFKGVALSSSQEELLEAVQEFHKGKKEQKLERMAEKHEDMVAFVSGTKSKTALLQEQVSRQNEVKLDKKKGASLWMDLLASLDEEQKDILFDNMQDLKQEHKERKEKSKHRRGRGE